MAMSTGSASIAASSFSAVSSRWARAAASRATAGSSCARASSTADGRRVVRRPSDGGSADDERAGAVAGLDDALQRERRERLAHRRAADLERARQIALGRQPLAGREHARSGCRRRGARRSARSAAAAESGSFRGQHHEQVVCSEYHGLPQTQTRSRPGPPWARRSAGRTPRRRAARPRAAGPSGSRTGGGCPPGSQPTVIWLTSSTSGLALQRHRRVQHDVDRELARRGRDVQLAARVHVRHVGARSRRCPRGISRSRRPKRRPTTR